VVSRAMTAAARANAHPDRASCGGLPLEHQGRLSPACHGSLLLNGP